jgi:hypothetical protein
LRDGDLIAIGHHQMRFAGPNAKPARASENFTPVEGDHNTTLIAATPAPLRSTSN